MVRTTFGVLLSERIFSYPEQFLCMVYNTHSLFWERKNSYGEQFLCMVYDIPSFFMKEEKTSVYSPIT